MEVQKLFELAQLTLKAHVREDHRSPLARKSESSLETHIVLVHKESDNA